MNLRTRLAVTAIAVLAVTLAGVSLLTYEIVRVTGRASVDQVLRQELDDLRAGLPDLIAEQAGGSAPTSEQIAAAVQRYLAVHPGSEQQLTLVSLGSERLTTRDGPAELLELREDGELPFGDAGELATVDTAEGPVRVLAAPLTDRSGTPFGQVTIAAPLSDVHEEARASLVRIAVAGLVGLVVGAAALAYVTRRALAPMRLLADAARSTGGVDLSSRVPEPAHLDEVGTVAREFNRMLDRISDDAERRQHLLAAISHELRTPVAVAKGHVEIFEVLGPDDEHTVAQLAGVVGTELDRISRLIDDLTAIGRGALGNEVELGAVFVPDVFDDLRARLAGLAMGAVVIADPPPLVIEADQGRVAQALLNLVLNAGTHNPAGTNITVSATHVGEVVELAVSDDGAGVDSAVAERAFEPFVTTRPGGPSRSAGLGLTVVRALTEAQGGTVDLSTSDAGTQVTLRFPAAADA